MWYWCQLEPESRAWEEVGVSSNHHSKTAATTLFRDHSAIYKGHCIVTWLTQSCMLCIIFFLPLCGHWISESRIRTQTSGIEASDSVSHSPLSILEMNFPRRKRLEQKWQPRARDSHSEELGGRRQPGKIPCYSWSLSYPLGPCRSWHSSKPENVGCSIELKGKKEVLIFSNSWRCFGCKVGQFGYSQVGVVT